MNLTGLAGFALASTLIELTPGPNMTWLAIVAAGEGRARGLAAVAGVALGLTVVGAAAALGLGAIVAASPVLFQTLRIGGTLYLLWLAWDAWRDASVASQTSEGERGLLRYFRRGFVVNVLNPKAAVFFVAVLPGFVDPGADIVPQLVTLTLIYVAVATAIHAGIVLLAGSVRSFLESPEAARRLRRTLALGLAIVALWFLWSSRG